MNDCPGCGRELEPNDAVTVRSFPDGVHPDADDPVPAYYREDGYWTHLACTDDAVQRWCRAGRPGSDPLDWLRSNGIQWTGLQQTGERARLILD